MSLAKMHVWTLLLPLLLVLRETSSSSVVEVSPDGVYSRLQVTIDEQSPPSNCSQFVENLEVGEAPTNWTFIGPGIMRWMVVGKHVP